MRNFFKIALLSVYICYAAKSYAQQDTLEAKPEHKSYLKVGATFLSDNVFLGRTDSVATPLFTPSVKYAFKSGVYFSGSLDIITNRPARKLDGGNLEIGYDHIGEGNLDWGASLTKLFFTGTSTQVTSAISSELSAYADYDIEDIVTASLSAGVDIGKSGVKGDFLLSPSLSHDFLIAEIFGEKDRLLISPQVGLNAGSQNFYSGYLVNKGKIKRKAVSAAYDAYSDQLGKFVLLDYEASLPIVYLAGKFSLTITPTYAFAKDNLPNSTVGDKLITAAIEKSQPIKTSVFFIETGISFKF